MPALPHEVIKNTSAVASFYYLDRFQANFWNKHRNSADTRIFTGWYWIDDSKKERGPFKTKSAAIRDAYYIKVLYIEPPSISNSKVVKIKTPTVIRFEEWLKTA